MELKNIFNDDDDDDDVRNYEFFVEIVETLRELGGSATGRKVREKIISEKQVSDYLMQKEIENKYSMSKSINFGATGLRKLGFLRQAKESPYGVWQLTDKGINANTVEFDQSEMVAEAWGNARNKTKQIAKIEDAGTIQVSEDAIIDQWKTDLLRELRSMTWDKFETFSRKLAGAMGIVIDKRIGKKLANDKGIDGYLEENGIRKFQVAIQAKRYQDTNTVGEPLMRDFLGALSGRYKEAAYGIFITSGYFNKEAIETARQSSKPITLIDGEKILELAEKYPEELELKPVTTYELGDFYANTEEEE
jgi:restriction system protein